MSAGKLTVDVSSSHEAGGSVVLTMRPEHGQEMRFVFSRNGDTYIYPHYAPIDFASRNSLLEGFAQVLREMGHQGMIKFIPENPEVLRRLEGIDKFIEGHSHDGLREQMAALKKELAELSERVEFLDKRTA